MPGVGLAVREEPAGEGHGLCEHQHGGASRRERVDDRQREPAPGREEALEIANSTDYKLTGGVFSRKPANLELARQQFRVGNLYLNRGNTGALVGRQPFGGFGLSGVGTKAGGEDYLLHFVEPRCCTENTMRHGFAPELE
jgi:hypothetical protein